MRVPAGSFAVAAVLMLGCAVEDLSEEEVVQSGGAGGSAGSAGTEPDSGTSGSMGHAGSVGTGTAGSGPCSLPDVPEGGLTSVIAIDGRSAYNPDVLFHGGRFNAYVPSVIFGDGAIYLSHSDDGLNWSTPERIVEEGIEVFVLPTATGFLMWQSIWPRSIVARESEDGVAWSAAREVYAGSGLLGPNGLPLDDGELHAPHVWYDGARFHLYYGGHADRVISDTGSFVASIGHAVSDDGLDFTFANWVFSSTSCPSGEPRFGSTLHLAGFVRPACSSCQLSGVMLIARGSICGDSEYHMYALTSADGQNFGSPQPIPHDLFEGTVLASQEGAVLYHGLYEDNATVALEEFDLASYGIRCQ